MNFIKNFYEQPIPRTPLPSPTPPLPLTRPIAPVIPIVCPDHPLLPPPADPPNPIPRNQTPPFPPPPVEWTQILDFESEGRRRRRTSFISRLTLTLICIFCFSSTPSVRSIDCSETQSYVVENSACIRKKGALECNISTNSIISVPPHGQTSCFLIKNSTSHPLGTLEIKFDEIEFICKSVTRHFTRFYKIKNYSNRQCAAFGSCVGTKCADLRMQESIPELEIVSEKSGHNFCVETCGFLSCGCPTPTAACLFYRIFAEEADPKTVQEVFNCPFWHPSITLEVLETTNNRTRKFKIMLSPGETWKGEFMKATLLSQITPHSSILNAFFITNSTHTALLDDELFENSKIFHCSNLKDAMNFKCSFPPDICLCLGAEKRVNCQCKSPLFEKAYIKNLLPLTLPSLTLQEYAAGDIKATFQQDTALQVQINFLDYPLISIFDESLCWVKPNPVIGCYRCRTGA